MSKFSLSSTWHANFRPHVNGERYRWSDLVLNLLAGKPCVLTLEFDGSYLIGDPESPIALYCDPDADVTGIKFEPPQKQLNNMEEDPVTFSSLSWIISTEQAKSGPIRLYFRMPLYQGMPDSPSIPGMIENSIIQSLICDRSVTYIGYEVNAQALVVDALTGRPLAGVMLKWSYGGQPLPDSISGADGVARANFVVMEVGEHDLVVDRASGFSDSRTQQIVVQALQPARVYGMSAYPVSLRLGESSEITATIRDVLTQKPLEGRKVHWEVDGDEFDMSYTDASGRVKTDWSATRVGAVKVWAYVYNQNNTEVGSVDLNVLDAASS